MKQVDGLKIKLYPHQAKGVEMISDFEFKRKVIIDKSKAEKLNKLIINHRQQYQEGNIIETEVGIYGDITGYGKTLTMLAYLTGQYGEQRNNIDYLKPVKKCEKTEETIYHCDFIKHHSKKEIHKELLPQTLILVNKQIAKQWENELKKTDLKGIVISMQKHIPESVEDYEVIVCTDTMSKYFYTRFEKYTWKRLIIDEPTENLVPYYYKADFYWLITASYMSIPIGTTRKSIFNKILPTIYNNGVSFLETLLVRNDPDFVPEIAGLIAAGNIKEAIIRLGGSSSDLNIFELVNKKKKDELREAKFKYDTYHQKYLVEKNRDYKTHYEKWEAKYQKLNQEIVELNNKYKDSIELGCTICSDDFEDNKIILLPCCQNIVCGVCLFGWMDRNSSCPYCRSPVDKCSIIYLEKNQPQSSNQIEDQSQATSAEASSKVILKMKRRERSRLEEIVSLIQLNVHRKYIIVSMYDETFEHIKQHLTTNDITYAEIKGQKAHIDKEIQRIYQGTHRVVFLNAQHQGTGLNLQLMTDIILYHDMDSSIVTQVMGRINRIGSNEIRGEIKPQLHRFIEKKQ